MTKESDYALSEPRVTFGEGASETFLALVDRVATYVVEINGEDYVCLGTSGMGVVVRRWDDEKACGVGPRITLDVADIKHFHVH
jgi:hypothetical protein